MGLDLGQRRIGVAVSDSEGRLALPYDTLTRGGDATADHRRISDIVDETGAEVVVVGMPTSLDGSVGPAARRAGAEVRALQNALGVPVETYDERFTTVSADRLLRESGRSGRRRREVVDTTAATVILQGWLDRHRHAGPDGARHDEARDDDD